MSRNKFIEEVLKDFPSKEDEEKRLKDLGERMSAVGIKPNFGKTPDLPDCPPCDYCGKEFSGSLICGVCKCVSYCSRECQKGHWKKHKRECSTMDQQCEEAAQKFLDTMADINCPISRKMDHGLWVALDGSSPYKKALTRGLNGTIQDLLKIESETVKKRFQNGIYSSFTQMLICTLFRNGRHIPGGLFSGIDAYRIKKYVLSSDDAFEQWFESSLKVIGIFANTAAASRNIDSSTFWGIQKIARDIAAGWSMVFTSSKASKAILLGSSKEPDDTAHTRVKWIIAQLAQLLPLFPFDSPDNSAVEGQVNQFTAMIDLRCEALGFDLGDFATLLHLKGAPKRMYNDMAIPFAEATMAKGRLLTNDECQQALMTHAQTGRRCRKKSTASISVSSSSEGAKSKGNKKKGRKGKRGRK